MKNNGFSGFLQRILGNVVCIGTTPQVMCMPRPVETSEDGSDEGPRLGPQTRGQVRGQQGNGCPLLEDIVSTLHVQILSASTTHFVINFELVTKRCPVAYFRTLLPNHLSACKDSVALGAAGC